MDHKPLFSIIVPVFNSQQYLEDCIGSILGQSFPNFELILVNDGSTDNSGVICDATADKDGRVKVIHKSNGGQGSARNMALKIVKGDYIMFIDSDDSIEADTLSSNYEILIDKPNIECIQFPLYRNYGTKNAFLDKGKAGFYTNASYFRMLLLDTSVISWIVCNKIIKRDKLKGLFFPEDIFYEDNFFVVDLIERLNNIYISEQGIYYYYHRENSTTTSKISLKSELSTCKVLIHILDKLELPRENKLFTQYFLRLINVKKSLKVNFKYELVIPWKYNRKLKISEIFKSKLNSKSRLKLLAYKLLN